MTAQDVINRAFRLTNAAGGTGEAPTADEASDALTWLNSMIDAWGLHTLTKYFLRRVTHALVSGTASYSIGSGGTINIVRPTEIRNAGLILDTAAATVVEAPIAVLTDDEYARWPTKTLQTTYVRGIWYDKNWSAGRGLIYVLPIPNVSTTQLVLYAPDAIAEFADLATTDYTFPPGYEHAIEYNLAVRLAGPFGRSVPDFVLSEARASLVVLKRANLRLAEVSIDPTFLGGRGRRTLSLAAFDGGLV